MNAGLYEGGEKMDFRRGRMRLNVGDRLSSLPDDLIHKILSYIDIRDAIETAELSSRWRYIWTSMPYLNFAVKDFSTMHSFSKFVTNVLYGRKPMTNLYSLKLSFRMKTSKQFVRRVLDYAFFHKIQHLSVVCVLEDGNEFPLSLFEYSGSLKHISLMMKINKARSVGTYSYLTSTWNLPTLTTLELHSVILCDDEDEKCIGVISKCVNLKNLKLDRFITNGSDVISIVHPRLSNLTLENGSYSLKVIKVAAPQLENLTIRSCHAELVISAPDLASLIYNSSDPLHLSTEGFHSLEKADICVIRPHDGNAHEIVSLLHQLHNVKYLTLNLEIVEILSSVDLILQQPSPFLNLKSLKIFPETEQPFKKVTVTISTKLKSYLLDGSPGSTFTMVLREEIKAQKFMAQLRVFLEKEKDTTKTNGAHLEQGKACVQSLSQIKSGWENLCVQTKKASLVISKLQSIEDLIQKLPAERRAKIQPCFSSLSAEVGIAISKITEYVKIQCDENQSLSTVCFQKLATTLEPSF